MKPSTEGNVAKSSFETVDLTDNVHAQHQQLANRPRTRRRSNAMDGLDPEDVGDSVEPKPHSLIERSEPTMPREGLHWSARHSLPSWYRLLRAQATHSTTIVDGPRYG